VLEAEAYKTIFRNYACISGSVVRKFILNLD